MTPAETNQFLNVDGVTVEGISADYVWYHAKVLSAKMSQWDHDFQRIVKVMEDRHMEHLKMVDRLLMENKVLRSQLKEKDDAKGAT